MQLGDKLLIKWLQQEQEFKATVTRQFTSGWSWVRFEGEPQQICVKIDMEEGVAVEAHVNSVHGVRPAPATTPPGSPTPQPPQAKRARGTGQRQGQRSRPKTKEVARRSAARKGNYRERL